MDTSRILSGGAIAGHLHISWSEQRKRIMRVATLIVSDLIQIATAQTRPHRTCRQVAPWPCSRTHLYAPSVQAAAAFPSAKLRASSSSVLRTGYHATIYSLLSLRDS